MRGCLARLNYRHTLDHYNEHLDKVIMVQNFVKNKIMGKAYRRLSKMGGRVECGIGITCLLPLVCYAASDSNPSIGTVKNFVHLLDDSDLDFDRELGMLFLFLSQTISLMSTYLFQLWRTCDKKLSNRSARMTKWTPMSTRSISKSACF